MWTRRRWLVTVGTVALAGCAGGGSGDGIYAYDLWSPLFYDDHWIYYYDDDDFLDGLSDEDKEALKQRWDSLSANERQAIREQWDAFGDQERSQVREAWSGLSADQREQVVTSMQARASNGTLRPVTPIEAGPSRFQARASGSPRSYSAARTRSFDRSRLSGRGRGMRGGGLGRRR